MDYVDKWYPAEALLARSIYGKRAASSLVAARATLGRRHAILRGAQSGRVRPSPPTASSATTSPAPTWTPTRRGRRPRRRSRGPHPRPRARARGRRGGHRPGRALDRRRRDPSKWSRTEQILPTHEITPGPTAGRPSCSPSSPTRLAGWPTCSPPTGTRPTCSRASVSGAPRRAAAAVPGRVVPGAGLD